MKRIASAALFVAVLACGSGDSGTSPSGSAPSATAPTAGGAAGTQGGAAGSSDVAAMPPESEIHPSVPRCLDLVRDGEYAEAVTPCTEAVRNAPNNREVAAALERARTEATAQATAAAQDAATNAAQDAATNAAAGSADDAASALQEQSGGLPTKLR